MKATCFLRQNSAVKKNYHPDLCSVFIRFSCGSTLLCSSDSMSTKTKMYFSTSTIYFFKNFFGPAFLSQITDAFKVNVREETEQALLQVS